MSNTRSDFTSAVSRFRTAIRRRVVRTGRVSAVDLNSVATFITGSTRGAAIRSAFQQLVSEDVIAPTTNTVVNPRNRHQVTVYGRA